MTGVARWIIFVLFSFVSPVALRYRNKDPAPNVLPDGIFLN
jgi:hypothetical protein